jgi:hypothetical protein
MLFVHERSASGNGSPPPEKSIVKKPGLGNRFGKDLRPGNRPLPVIFIGGRFRRDYSDNWGVKTTGE